jgi:hypothetical protein
MEEGEELEGEGTEKVKGEGNDGCEKEGGCWYTFNDEVVEENDVEGAVDEDMREFMERGERGRMVRRHSCESSIIVSFDSGLGS